MGQLYAPWQNLQHQTSRWLDWVIFTWEYQPFAGTLGDRRRTKLTIFSHIHYLHITYLHLYLLWQALVSPDGVAPSRMVGLSASVNLSLHHKVQKFSSGTGSSGWSQKKGCKTVVVVVCGLRGINYYFLVRQLQLVREKECSAVAEMGDSLATINMGRILGGLCPF